MEKKKAKQRDGSAGVSLVSRGPLGRRRYLARILVPLIVAILAIAAFAGRRFLFPNTEREALLASLSTVDLSGMEPQVAAKIQSLQEDVRRNPDSVAAWRKLAVKLDAHDLKKEAVPLYQKAASLDSSDFRSPYFCAILLAQIGSSEALEWFERAYKIRPDYVPLLVNYGDALFHLDRTNQAIEKYGQALRLDPNRSRAYFGLAQISFSQGDMQATRINVLKALESDPSNGEAYGLLVSVCRRLNDEDCAARASAMGKRFSEKTLLSDPVYAELVAEGESSLWYRFRGSEYLKKRLYDAAVREFQTALKLRPDAQSHEDLAAALSSAGKLQEAAQQYRHAVAAHPTARNYFGLALMHAKMGRYPEAEELFRKAIERKPDFAEAYFNLAVVFAKMGRPSATIEALKEAIRIKADYVEAHYHLGLVYLAANDRAGLMKEYKILTTLDQNAAEQLRNLIDQKKASNITAEAQSKQ